jgi:hypothetical protein
VSRVSKEPPHLSRSEIETIDRALNQFKLAVASPRRDLRRPAAVSLRTIGFSVNQILTLSRGRWPRSSVQRWVAGVRTAAEAPAERATELLAVAVERNWTMDQLYNVFSAQLQLAAQGVTVDDVVRLIAELREQNVALHDLIQHYRMMRDNGLGFADVKRHLDYRASLETLGFGLDSLRLISQAAAKFNQNPDVVLSAIDSYASMQDIESHLTPLREARRSEETRLAQLNGEVATLETRQRELAGKIQEGENTIQQLENVTKLGYNLESLTDLQRRTSTLGGLEDLLTALARYEDLNSPQNDIHEKQDSLKKLQAKEIEMKAANAHLATHIEMTQKLIDEHKLGLDAIQDLLQIATKYGPPEEVFKALKAYEDLRELETKVSGKRIELADLTEKERELSEKLKQHIPEIEEKLASLSESLNADIEATKSNLRKDVESLLASVHEAGKTYQELTIRAEQSEPYLEMMHMTTDPASVTNPRVIETLKLILTKIQEWIKLHDSVFDYPALDIPLLDRDISALLRTLSSTRLRSP